MVPKRRTSVESAPEEKRSRKVMTLAEKVVILDKLRTGRTAASLGREYQVNESTIRTIRKCEEKIRESFKCSASINAKVSQPPRRNPNVEKMEKLLNAWIGEQVSQKGWAIDSVTVREKARSLYEHVVKTEGENSSTGDFLASKEWFTKFAKRFILHNSKLQGEAAVSADHEAAARFKLEFKEFIKEKGYTPEQVFNADETGLFYKKMGNRTYIDKLEKEMSPAFSAFRDRLTLLFCGNASGDFKCKPLLVYRSENPRSLRGKNKHHLPVVWRSNEKAWVTRALFDDWLQNCFVHEVKEYLTTKNLDFKVLLILDNAFAHDSETLQFSHPNIEIMFLPPNTTPVLQPMNQGAIMTFKAYYTRNMYRRAIQAIDSGAFENLIEFWEAYDIKHCISIIKTVWDEVKPSTLNACWHCLWPEVVKDFKRFPTVNKEIAEIVRLAQEIRGEGFDDMKEEEVNDLLKSHCQEPTHEELEELIAADSQESDEDIDELCKPTLTAKAVSDFLCKADELIQCAADMDPIMERSFKFQRELDYSLAPYREILKDLRRKAKQQEITDFLSIELKY